MNNCENCVHHIDDVCEHYYESNVNTCTGFRPVTPQGKWIKNEHTFWTCSHCNWFNDMNRIKYNFCPNCGAKMKGGAE